MARWSRILLPWLAVGLAHVAVLGALLHVQPQPVRSMPTTIQASLIAPRPLIRETEAKAPELAKPSQPPEKQPEKPKRERIAAPAREEASLPAPEVERNEAPEVAPLASAAATTASAASDTGSLIPPIFNADYLDNPKPPYPMLSRRNGETGRVMLRVYVTTEGRAGQVEVDKSSGFERLDNAARNAVAGWRFVPARRGSEHVAAWVLVPISFVM